MEKKVFQEFEKICSAREIRGSVLEVGATPDDSSLLTMTSLQNAAEKVGINLDGPYSCKNFSIIKGNANAMSNFEKGRFDVVLCNSVFEHDKYFWMTLAEIKRVAKSGGLIVLGAPGYRVSKTERYFHGFFKRIPFLSRFFPAHSTITLSMHDYPGDYYRFSPQAFKEVFFAGMKEVEIRVVLSPPRIIGWGIKP
jgi:ubiquinone/menaquinone biosynthesis C-methylase UbiE